MAPFLQAAGAVELAKTFQTNALTNANKTAWLEYGYYNGVLGLFAQGFMDKQYRFNSLGELLPKGKEVKPCG